MHEDIYTKSKKRPRNHGSESEESGQDTGESQGAHSKANARGSHDSTVSSTISGPAAGGGGRAGRAGSELLEGGKVVGTRLDSVDREDHARLAVVDLATITPDGCGLKGGG